MILEGSLHLTSVGIRTGTIIKNTTIPPISGKWCLTVYAQKHTTVEADREFMSVLNKVLMHEFTQVIQKSRYIAEWAKIITCWSITPLEVTYAACLWHTFSKDCNICIHCSTTNITHWHNRSHTEPIKTKEAGDTFCASLSSIVKSLNGLGWRGPWTHLVPTLCHGQGHLPLDHIAQTLFNLTLNFCLF